MKESVDCASGQNSQRGREMRETNRTGCLGVVVQGEDVLSYCCQRTERKNEEDKEEPKRSQTTGDEVKEEGSSGRDDKVRAPVYIDCFTDSHQQR